MQCWFWNIDRSQQPYFASELSAGRLRQGWGWEDLRDFKSKLDHGEKLTDQESSAWNRCSQMLTQISKDDLVVVKNVPSFDGFTIVRVTGAYGFEINHPDGWDYGHYLQVKYHQDKDNDTSGLDQLERAFVEHRASALLLVTFANDLGDDLRRRVDDMKRKYIFDVLYGEELRGALLEVIADRTFSSDE
jgi:hypothetical protein